MTANETLDALLTELQEAIETKRALLAKRPECAPLLKGWVSHLSRAAESFGFECRVCRSGEISWSRSPVGMDAAKSSGKPEVITCECRSCGHMFGLEVPSAWFCDPVDGECEVGVGEAAG